MACTGCNAKRSTLYRYELTEQFLGHVGDWWFDTQPEADLPKMTFARPADEDVRGLNLELQIVDISVVTGTGSCVETSGSCDMQEGCSATMEVLWSVDYTVFGFPEDDPTSIGDPPDISFPTLPDPFRNEQYVREEPTVTTSYGDDPRNLTWRGYPGIEGAGIFSTEYTITLRQVFTMDCDSDLIVTLSFADLPDDPGNIEPECGFAGGGTLPREPSEDSGHFFWHSIGELEIAMGCDKCYRSVRVPGGDDQKPGSQGGGKNYNQSSI